ncbi:class D sortase [Shimazuella sp. AN120528]|uniref:class D sortase n=1 Tax=Shimazuella soli TaxID=1892854 RepID=UPI001F10E917|nr:class D sortase [Shimazuella soli]MCH5585320.1 class D sortase [Shimazuella soli]
MIRKLAWIIIIVGVFMMVFNGFQWWDQLRRVVYDPIASKKVAANWDDRHTQKALSEGIASKNTKLKVSGQIGELIIPRMGAILPIVQGTDDESLKKGVGHYIGYGTVNPGETGHVVLSGHRDTVFRGAGQLKIGDRLYVKFQGHIYTYQIRKTWITNPEDRTIIVPIPKPVLTLTTCYPFDYIGSAPERYIIRADLIEVKKDNGAV